MLIRESTEENVPWGIQDWIVGEKAPKDKDSHRSCKK